MAHIENPYKVSRRWWFPFAVEVWQLAGEGEHWKKGHYSWWVRKGVFFRRSTAEQFAKWLQANR